MEVTTIIGIVVAVIIILVGLRMVLRKPNDAAPSLESELHINEDCKQPVIPRHVRDQLRTDRESQEQVRVEPNLTALDSVEVVDEKQQKIEDAAAESNVVQSTELEHAAITQQTEKTDTVASAESTTESEKALNVQTEPTTQTNDSAKVVISQDKEEAFQFNAHVETAEIKEFDEESSILDVHLNEQQKYDDESVLSTAETIIALNVYPNPRKALSGDKTLKMLLKYGLRFGELSCFHRYENPEEESHLLFSVLRVTDNGPRWF